MKSAQKQKKTWFEQVSTALLYYIDSRASSTLTKTKDTFEGNVAKKLNLMCGFTISFMKDNNKRIWWQINYSDLNIHGSL